MGAAITRIARWWRGDNEQQSWLQNLPNELLVRIFHLLGLKEIAQLQCVCRNWRELLTDKCLIQQQYSNQYVFLEYQADIYSTRLSNLQNHGGGGGASRIEFDHLFRMKGWTCSWVMSTKGVFCIPVGTTPRPSLTFALSHGFTRTTPETIVIDNAWPSNIKSRDAVDVDVWFGFGYAGGGDHKILSVKRFEMKATHKVEWIVRIYSLKHDSWKDVLDHPLMNFSSASPNSMNALFSHGCLCWVMYEKAVPKFILRYDLCKEEFAENISLPKENEGLKNSRYTTLDGELSSYRVELYGGSNVWVLEPTSSSSKGGRSSWNKLVSVPNTQSSHKHYYKPIAWLKEQKVVLLFGSDFQMIQTGPPQHQIVLSWYHVADKKIIKVVDTSIEFSRRTDRPLKHWKDDKQHGLREFIKKVFVLQKKLRKEFIR